MEDQGNVIAFPGAETRREPQQYITLQLTYSSGEVGYSIEGMQDSPENRQTIAVCLEAVIKGLRRRDRTIGL